MQGKSQATFVKVLVVSIILNLIGWIGLILLISFTLPSLFPRWLFFFLLTCAFCGISLPFIFLLHRRFPSETPADMNVWVREAIWVGLFVDLITWLQLGRMLTPARGLLIAIGFVAIEYFLRLREANKFKPKDTEMHE